MQNNQNGSGRVAVKAIDSVHVPNYAFLSVNVTCLVLFGCCCDCTVISSVAYTAMFLFRWASDVL